MPEFITDKYMKLLCKNCGSGKIQTTELDDYECSDCGSEEAMVIPNYEGKNWAIAIYHVDRYYGGPEEGGWWYERFERALEEPILNFADFESAVKEFNSLVKEYKEFNGAMRPVGFTDMEPFILKNGTKPTWR